jgi:hypothetical protein
MVSRTHKHLPVTLNFVMYVYDISVIRGMLCPSRYSNPVDDAKCSTVAYMYLEFHLIDCYSSSVADEHL